MTCKIAGNHRYSWIKKQRSLFMSRTRCVYRQRIALEELAILNEARTLRELVIKCTGRAVVFLRKPINSTCTGGACC